VARDQLRPSDREHDRRVRPVGPTTLTAMRERYRRPVIRKRVLVVGRVQGIGFRAACAREARAAGVAGMVRNLDDGRVEAVFEGPPDSVDALVAWCEDGPSSADVRRVRVHDEHPLGETVFRVT
jgi:acylphosphatase